MYNDLPKRMFEATEWLEHPLAQSRALQWWAYLDYFSNIIQSNVSSCLFLVYTALKVFSLSVKNVQLFDSKRGSFYVPHKLSDPPRLIYLFFHLNLKTFAGQHSLTFTIPPSSNRKSLQSDKRHPIVMQLTPTCEWCSTLNSLWGGSMSENTRVCNNAPSNAAFPNVHRVAKVW